MTLPLIDLILIIVAAVAGTIAIVMTGILTSVLRKKLKTVKDANTLPTTSKSETYPEQVRASKLHKKKIPKSQSYKQNFSYHRYYMPSTYVSSPKQNGQGSEQFNFMNHSASTCRLQDSPTIINSPASHFYSTDLSKEKSLATLACRNETSDDNMSSKEQIESASANQSPLCQRTRRDSNSIVLSYIKQYSSSSTLSSALEESQYLTDIPGDNNTVVNDHDSDNSFKFDESYITTSLTGADESNIVFMTAKRVPLSNTNSKEPNVVMPQSLHREISSSQISSSNSNVPELTIDYGKDSHFKDSDSSSYSCSQVSQELDFNESGYNNIITCSTPKKINVASHVTPQYKKFDLCRIKRDYYNSRQSRSSTVPFSFAEFDDSALSEQSPFPEHFQQFKDMIFYAPHDELTNS